METNVKVKKIQEETNKCSCFRKKDASAL